MAADAAADEKLAKTTIETNPAGATVRSTEPSRRRAHRRRCRSARGRHVVTLTTSPNRQTERRAVDAAGSPVTVSIDTDQGAAGWREASRCVRWQGARRHSLCGGAFGEPSRCLGCDAIRRRRGDPRRCCVRSDRDRARARCHDRRHRGRGRVEGAARRAVRRGRPHRQRCVQVGPRPRQYGAVARSRGTMRVRSSLQAFRTTMSPPMAAAISNRSRPTAPPTASERIDASRSSWCQSPRTRQRATSPRRRR